MPTEKSLQQWTKKCLKGYGILTYKFESPGTRGVPDLVCVGRFGTFFIELKSPKGTGRLSPLQMSVQQEMRDHGASVYVCSSKAEVAASLQFEGYTLSMHHKQELDKELHNT